MFRHFYFAIKNFPVAFVDTTYLQKTNPLGRWNTISSIEKESMNCILQNKSIQNKKYNQSHRLYEIYGNIDNSC